MPNSIPAVSVAMALLSVVVISIIFGFLRGAARSKFRLALVIFSAIVSYVVVLLSRSVVATEANAVKLLNYLQTSGIMQVPENVDEMLSDALISTGTALIAPVLFIVLFIGLMIVTWALYFVITTILIPVFHKKNKKTKARHLKAAINGLVQGVVLAVVIMIPVATYSKAAPVVAENVEKAGVIDKMPAEQQPQFKQALEQAKQINNDPATVVFRKIGGNFLCNSLTNVKLVENGQKINVNVIDEADGISQLVNSAMVLSKTPVADYTEAEANILLQISENFKTSHLVPAIASDFIHTATSYWKDGNAFMGVQLPSMGADFDPILNQTVLIFYSSSSDAAYLKDDLASMSKLLAVFAKEGVLKNTDNPELLVQSLTEKEVIPQISVILGESPRLSTLMPSITNLSISLLAKTLGIPADNTAVYDTMMTNISGKLDETKGMPAAERVVAVKNTLTSSFDTAGINLEPEYVDLVATALVQDFGDFDGEITPEFIAEFFTIYNSYYNAEGGLVIANGHYGYVNLEAGSTPENAQPKEFTYPGYKNGVENSAASAIGKFSDEVADIMLSDKSNEEKLAGIRQSLETNVDKICDELTKNETDKTEMQNFFKEMGNQLANVEKQHKSTCDSLSTLNSAEKADIKCTTAQSLMGDLTTEELDKDEVKKQGDALNAMLGCASSILGADQSDKGAMLDAVTKGVGGMLDSLTETKLFGKDGTSKIFGAILESNMAKETLGLSKEEIDNIKTEIETNENTDYTNMMTGISGIGNIILGFADGQITIDKVKTVIVSLDGGNSSIISSLITEERAKQMGIPEAKIKDACKLLKIFLTNLGKTTEENLDNEATAVKYLLDLAFSSKGSSQGSLTLFGENGLFGITADEFMTHVTASHAISDTCSQIYTDGVSNPFSLKLDDKSASEITSALNNFMKNNPDEASKNIANGIAALLGINL